MTSDSAYRENLQRGKSLAVGRVADGQDHNTLMSDHLLTGFNVHVLFIVYPPVF